MTNRTRQLPPFEPFEVRRQKCFLEIILRMMRVCFALYLWGCSVVAAVVLSWSWPQGRDLIQILPVLLSLALIFTFVAAWRLMYWRVDQDGIHQRCLGVKNWDLPWDAIVARQVGRDKSEWVLLFRILPIAGGPYQATLLEARTGRKRRFNRLATNGDRLDALVQSYLNQTEEAEAKHALTPLDALPSISRCAPPREVSACGAQTERRSAPGRWATCSRQPLAIRELHHPPKFPTSFGGARSCGGLEVGATESWNFAYD